MTTKLGAPPLPAGYLERTRLLDRLDRGAQGPVTLVAAPAGTGKTALLSAWSVSGRAPGPVAWLSLDTADDQRRFWSGVLAAVGRNGLDGLSSTSAMPFGGLGDTLLTTLVNALATLPHPLVLVLEDLHEVVDPAVMADLDRLLGHQPEPLRLVISTRVDPSIRLQRLRVQGSLTEIRAADLNFTEREALELLGSTGLEPGDIRTLWRRTGGWVVGLRLAALALAGHPDPRRLVAEFAEIDATVADYLVGEMLARQPPELRRFLLETSVADILDGGLADAITGRTDSARVLAQLEHGNALISSLDERHSRYRYHPLFAEVLRTELRYERPGREEELHRSAAGWLAARGSDAEAVQHALAARDWPFAADLVTTRWMALLLRGQMSIVQSLLGQLPQERLHEPDLAVVQAAVHFDADDHAAADEALRRAEEGAARVPAERRAHYLVGLAIVRLFRGRKRGDVKGALDAVRSLVEFGDRLPEIVPGPDLQAVALTHLGIVELWAGRFDAAGEHLEGGLAAALEARQDYHIALCLAHLSILPGTGAPAGRAADQAREALKLLERRGWTRTSAAAAAYLVLGSLHYHGNDLEAAEHNLGLAEQAATVADPPLRAAIALARVPLLVARGRLNAALAAHTGAAEDLGDWPVFDLFRHVMAAEEGLVRAALGEEREARTLLRRRYEERSSPEVAVALASLRLADGDPGGALELVDAAGHTELIATMVEAAVVRAIAHETLGSHDEATRSIEHALDLAEPLGLRRVIVAHGAPVRALLRGRLRHGTGHAALVSELLDDLDRDQALPRLGSRVLVQPLSERERTVLRYLPTMLSYMEIARELYVSPNTLKTHARSIYRKLGVDGRRGAVARGRELRLLGPGRDPAQQR